MKSPNETGLKTPTFINESGLKFTDISSEKYRQYVFGKDIVTIIEPLWLHVSSSGGHRLFDAAGKSHYVVKGWHEIQWEAKEGQPHFVK